MIIMFIKLDYPREVLDIDIDSTRGFRKLVKDERELSKFWSGKNGSGNVYMTAYGYVGTTPPKHHRVNYNTPVIRHFVMDFDCKDFTKRGATVSFSEMHEQAKRLHQHLLLNDYRHFIWFSGGGFHFWIPISKTWMPTTGLEVSKIKHAGKNLIANWHKELRLGCNDPTVAFDTAGMIRIPNSYNAKRGCWMIPMDSDEFMELDYDAIMELAQEPRSGYIEHGSIDVELKVTERKSDTFNRNVKKVDLPDVSLDKIIVLPCIAQAALGEGNPIHRARFHLVNYLAARFRWFFPPNRVEKKEKEEHVDKIVSICASQGWVDFKEAITRFQTESIVMGDYSPSTCRTLMTEGFCTGICKYYDNTAEDLV